MFVEFRFHKKTVRIFIIKQKMKRIALNQIPDDIIHNTRLNEALKVFPANYNFEIHKTIWKIVKNKCKRSA